MSRSLVLRIVAMCVLSLAGSELRAQLLQPELRLDVLGPPPASIEPGVGVNARLGHYVRIGGAVGYDVRGHETRAGRRWRGDLTGRFTFDPFRQQRWAVSLGGGVSYRGSTTYLALLADVEGPDVRGLLPSFQLGVSGGVRAGMILRRTIRGRR